MDDETTIPTGSGQSAGEPSPDDNAAVSDALETPNPTNAGGDTDSDSPDSSREIGDEQTTVEQFE
jgi:deoxyribodipyrimidine photo-lyase